MTFKKLALQTVLISNFFLTACGGDGGKVYPNGTGPNKQEDDRGEKPSGTNNKYITSHIAGSVSVALLTLNRAVDIALNKENAASLLKERDCQKLTVADGSVTVTTDISNCRRARSANDWGGSEQLDITTGSNGVLSTLKTKSQTYGYTVASRRHDHELVADITVTKSSNPRPGNTMTYDFDQTLIIRSNGADTTSMDEARREERNEDEREARGSRRDSTPRSFEGRIDVVISGKIEVDLTTKAITGISLTSATVDGQREIRRGRTALQANTSLVLNALSGEIVPMTNGRMTADFSGKQTIELGASSGRTPRKVDYNAEVRFETGSIKVEQTRPMNLSASKPGFETILTDLESIIQQFFRTLAN